MIRTGDVSFGARSKDRLRQAKCTGRERDLCHRGYDVWDGLYYIVRL